jgi:hypothetical protein
MIRADWQALRRVHYALAFRIDVTIAFFFTV